MYTREDVVVVASEETGQPISGVPGNNQENQPSTAGEDGFITPALSRRRQRYYNRQSLMTGQPSPDSARVSLGGFPGSASKASPLVPGSRFSDQGLSPNPHAFPQTDLKIPSHQGSPFAGSPSAMSDSGFQSADKVFGSASPAMSDTSGVGPYTTFRMAFQKITQVELQHAEEKKDYQSLADRIPKEVVDRCFEGGVLGFHLIAWEAQEDVNTIKILLWACLQKIKLQGLEIAKTGIIPPKAKIILARYTSLPKELRAFFFEQLGQIEGYEKIELRNNVKQEKFTEEELEDFLDKCRKIIRRNHESNLRLGISRWLIGGEDVCVVEAYISDQPRLQPQDDHYHCTRIFKTKKGEEKVEEKDDGLSLKAQAKTAIADILGCYQREWFKAADRSSNADAFLKAVNQLDVKSPDYYVTLLSLHNEAKLKALKSDLDADSSAWFFKRNFHGSRYQVALQQVHGTIFSHVPEDEKNNLFQLEAGDLDNMLIILIQRMKVKKGDALYNCFHDESASLGRKCDRIKEYLETHQHSVKGSTLHLFNAIKTKIDGIQSQFGATPLLEESPEGRFIYRKLAGG